MGEESEEMLLRSVAQKTSQSILLVRQRAEQEVLLAKQALEARSEELAHSLSIMRTTLDSTADGILVVDEKSGVVDFNEQFLRLWKISRELVTVGSHRDSLLQVVSQQLKDPAEFRRRTEEIYRSSPPDSLDVLEFQLRWVDDRGAGRVWSYRDITHRIQAEENLRDQARVLELLNKTGAAIAAQLDLQNAVQIVTDAATELTGANFGVFFYRRSEAAADGAMLFTLSGADREAFSALGDPRTNPLLAPTFQGKGPIRTADLPGGVPGLPLATRSYLAMPVISGSGAVSGGLFFGHAKPGVFGEQSERIIIGVAAQAAIAIDNARLYDAAQRELAERKRAEAEREKLLVSEREARERAERETRMKDEFLATLSHELRTPLNAILGWANILRNSTEAEIIAEGIEVIERNARAQAKIIEDLLDMSRIISGNVRLDVQRVELDSIIKIALESVSPMAAAKEIAITSECDPQANLISADPARLQQVLWNLLTNALKFTPKGGQVRVALQRCRSNVCIAISDSGLGITPDFLPHVFDRFRQADSSTTRRHGGLGLGLAIVKNLVELHGGTVRAESAGENQGSTITITLPVAAVNGDGVIAERITPPLRAENSPVPASDFSGLRVLAIDDELDARELVEWILQSRGASVATASSSAEALELMRKMKPHILITDIGMPDEDGYAILQKVRQLSAEEGGAVPAIALTAFARAEDRERAVRSGFQVHLAKPFEAAELIATVAKLTGRDGGKPAQPEFDYDRDTASLADPA